MNWRRFAFIPLIACVAFTACSKKKEEPLFYESSRKGTAEAPVGDVPKDIIATQQAFTALVNKVTPSVVNISTVSKKKIVQPFFEFSPFFNDFFGSRPQYKREKSLGSGFIINKDGYIVTNDHVVRDAESIQVKLSNANVYTAKVVGSDPKTDIAVIKITPKEELPVAVLGDSDKIQVGQWAIAIGNPFGLDRTVTVGVISATGRSNMGIETYEDFIQTDASINPGNSGGPLLNVYGEVVGINTAIVAAGQGIGFAIPANMSKQIVTQLISKGNVSRGWLGVTIQPVTPEVAQSFGLKKAAGALVSDVMEGGPAAKGGIRQGDVIIRVDGKEVKDVQHLQRLIAAAPIGKSLSIDVYREGSEQKLTVAPVSSDSAPAARQRSESATQGWIGLSIAELPKELSSRGLSGVLVADVEEGSPAADAGFQQGDVIVTLNQRRIKNIAEYGKALKEAEVRGFATFLVKRGGASIYFSLKLR